ncbi:uncharacterized protein BJ171DRAFT_488638 [Polychytrium aggregatum]|uniref:uncharacterized protein n=1 Tax=Polychytrium aggregatum TaxID=110093 RepID=UPI0022FE7F8F|nr:uncharacterized protein BJ171DRAFT_488638 [Polychytrium aggregatum]KAI9209147.1 hypothetical protein BJ171DRAFT_488638 [Polychytrium aggregatum]
MTTSIFQNDIFKGKVAFVTGGGSGICKGMTEALMRHGADSVIVSRTLSKLEVAAKELAERTGRRCLPLACDVRNYADLETAFRKAQEHYGRIDIVICGAAGNFLASAERLSANGFKTVMEIDTIGTFNTCKAALPHLKQTKGCIISVSATFHYVGSPLQIHAAAAKAGVDAMTRTLAAEWGAYGIRINTITPGPIAGTTGMEKLTTKDTVDLVESVVPLKTWGQIRDIEYATLFLAHPESARFISGAVLVVDGGQWLVSGGGIVPESQWRGKL